MSSREEFEDWWKHAPFIQSHVAKSAAYGIWQASRAALVVELPKSENLSSPEALCLYDEVKFELEAAGVQVTP